MGLQKFLRKAIAWGGRKSLAVMHFNSGVCNGCDVEAIAALAPHFDVERLGVVQQGIPRQADILICTGAVTLQTQNRLQQIYEQMPEPKFVVAVGACACSGGVFAGCYGVVGGIDAIIPVNAYLPGCAVRPEALIDVLNKLLADWEDHQQLALAEPLLLEPQDLPAGTDNSAAAVEADDNQPAVITESATDKGVTP